MDFKIKLMVTIGEAAGGGGINWDLHIHTPVYEIDN